MKAAVIPPFFNNYRPQFYFRTTDVTGVVSLPEGVEMCMPGDNVEMDVELITPLPLRKACVSLSVKAAVPSGPCRHQDQRLIAVL